MSNSFVGAFAVLRHASPGATVAKLEADLKATGTPIQVAPNFVVPRVNVNAARNADSTPPATPGSFVASGSSASVGLSWTASPDADLDYYEISRRASSSAQFAVVAQVETGVTHTDTFSLAASKMYEYQIVAVDTSGNRSAPAKDSAVTVTFTEDPLPVPDPNNLNTVTLIRGAHVAQLREAADAWREFAQLARLHGSDAGLTGPIRAADLVVGQATSVVDALNGARQALSLPPFGYSGVAAPAGAGVVRRLHIQQLRDAMR